MTLGQYCLKNIFEPLGCKDIQFGVSLDARVFYVVQARLFLLAGQG